MMKIKIQLEKKDLRAFIRYNLLHNYPIYFLIITFAFFLFNLGSRSYPLIKKDYIISSVSILSFSIILFLLYYGLNSLFSGTMKDKKFLQEKIYEFTDKEIIVYINEAKFPINWKEFSLIKDSKNYFFLYINKNQAIIIPKRFLNTDEKKEIHQYLKKAAKKISA